MNDDFAYEIAAIIESYTMEFGPIMEERFGASPRNQDLIEKSFVRNRNLAKQYNDHRHVLTQQTGSKPRERFKTDTDIFGNTTKTELPLNAKERARKKQFDELRNTTSKYVNKAAVALKHLHPDRAVKHMV